MSLTTTPNVSDITVSSTHLSGEVTLAAGANVTLTPSGQTITIASSASGGVTSITGTANQVIASASTGAVTLSTPQDIATSSFPTFAGIKLSGTGPFSVNINSVSTNALEDITSDASAVFQSLLESHTNTAASAPTISAIRSRGTAASPTIDAINDAIGFHNFYGYTGNSGVGYQLASQVQYWICADGTTVSTTSMPGRIQFFTTPDLSVTPAERMRINCTGTISLFGILQMDANKIIGDTASGGNLTLNSTTNATKGSLIFDDKMSLWPSQPNFTASLDVINYSPTFTANPAASANLYLINYSPTVTANPGAGSAFAQEILHMAPTVTFSGGLAYVYRAVSHLGTFTSTANASFGSTFNLFIGSPTMTSSTASVFPIPITSILNCSPIFSGGNVNVGTSFSRGVVHATSAQNTGASAVLTMSDITGFVDQPSFAANTAGGAVNITLRRLAAFKNFSSTITGTVTVSANVGYDIEDQSVSSGNLTVTRTSGIRSSLVANAANYFIDDTGGAQVSLTGKITKYNAITSVNGGVPNQIAAVNLLTQSAAIATTLYAVPAAGAGQYRLNWNAKITRAATTSSILGGLTIVYTDPDGVVQTISAGAQQANGTLALTAVANTTTTVILGYSILLNCKASTNITYAFAYTSVGVTTMQYNINISLEDLR